MSDDQTSGPRPEVPQPSPDGPPRLAAHSAQPRVVVGVDGSDLSLSALRRGVRMAVALGGVLEAVIVWHFPDDGFLYPPVTEWSPEKDAGTVVQTAADAVVGTNWPEWFTVSTHQGSPAQVLIEESEGAEMLILGDRGHGGFPGLLLGSVSASCARHAHCPVLIVRGPSDT
ncbi:MAG TPA: universal stress protein [Terrimesophilobacter sp.]|jgi:Universal stress protein UspA and related nucleotide-binding proteins|uniref:universal stress protein n=1 Tax=Terrimesophilobacter sp. TaxID=2906435 RepID=UPI002F95217F